MQPPIVHVQESAVALEREKYSKAISRHLPRTLTSIAADYACTRMISGQKVRVLDQWQDARGVVSDATGEFILSLMSPTLDHELPGRLLLCREDGTVVRAWPMLGASIDEERVDRSLVHAVCHEDRQFTPSYTPPATMSEKKCYFRAAVDEDGDYYVISNLERQIFVLDGVTKDEKRKIGLGCHHDSFGTIIDIVYDKQSSRLIVSDQLYQQLHWLTCQGEVIRVVPLPKNIHAGHLTLHGPYLYMIDVHGKGKVTCVVFDSLSSEWIASVVLRQDDGGQSSWSRPCIVNDKLCVTMEGFIILYE